MKPDLGQRSGWCLNDPNVEKQSSWVSRIEFSEDGLGQGDLGKRSMEVHFAVDQVNEKGREEKALL